MLKREKVSRTLLHKIIVAVGVFFLFWPAITTNLFSAGLIGYVPKTPPPKLSLQDWFDFSFQDAADHWWLERFGLRGLFVRLNNQINYTFFDKIYEGGTNTVFGKGDWLYNYAGMASYCGIRSPVPEQDLRDLFVKTKRFQDQMDVRGVPFVLLVTPTKSATYPEHLPAESCLPHEGGGADYDTGIAILDEIGVRYVDGFRLTRDARLLWPDAPLFTRGGAHWSTLAAFYSARAILEEVYQARGLPVPELVLDDVVVDNHPVGTDRDLIDLFNLLYSPANFPAAHIKVSMAAPADAKLRGIFIGMSFLQQITMVYADTDAFEQLDHYWYYDTAIHDRLNGGKVEIDREDIDWDGEILSADLLVLDVNMAVLTFPHAHKFLDDGLAWLEANGQSEL